MSPASRGSAEAASAGIGRRVAALRVERKLRVSELARRIGVSSSLISQIERGQSRPSVDTLFSLAQALGVAVDTFFTDEQSPDGGETPPSSEPAGVGESPSPATRASQDGVVVAFPSSAGSDSSPGASLANSRPRYVVRKHERASIDIRGGVRWERLTPTALDGVEFLELVYAPGAESDHQLYRHPGIELVLVTLGAMTIFVGFEQHELGVNDSIAFPSSTPHRYVNLTDAESRAVTVILRDDLSAMVQGASTTTASEGGLREESVNPIADKP